MLVPGDAGSLRTAAARWLEDGAVAARVAADLRLRQHLSGWTGDAADAYAHRVITVAATWDAVAAVLRSASGALDAYVGSLDWAQDRAQTAIDLWGDAEQETTAALLTGTDAGAGDRDLARSILADARIAVAVAGDQAAAALNAAVADPGLRLPVWLAAGLGDVSPADATTTLVGMPGWEVAALLRARPELAALLQEANDTQVASWWQGLSETDRALLVTAAPAVIGGLGGVSPASRVAANRIMASVWRDQLLETIADRPTTYAPGTYAPQPGGPTPVDQATLDYLQSVIDGDVQLYDYDPGTHTVIEMIGTIGPGTTDVNTFVPGTFTSMTTFANGDAQAVGNWLSDSTGGSMVTFVVKEGLFPGEDTVDGDSNILRIGEANDETAALAAGARVAAFQDELHAAIGSTGADYNAIGYSWGLAAVTSSEVAGAHYTDVISLAGAGEPAAWQPDPTTDYTHLSYVDALSMAQDAGLVWDGRNPATTPAFDSTIYPSDGDYEITVPEPYDGAPVTPTVIDASRDPVGSHLLIASDDPANRRALQDLLAALQ